MRRLTRRQWRLLLLGAAAALVAVLGYQWRAAIKRNRSVPDELFQIAGNLYYVGSTGVTAFLLTGPQGHVLIDGGYPETAPLIIASIAKLGFDVADVEVLLNSHAHFDHAGGLRELQEASGAELWISEGDAEMIAAGGAGDRRLAFAASPNNITRAEVPIDGGIVKCVRAVGRRNAQQEGCIYRNPAL